MDTTPTRDSTGARVLLVADWAVDPHAVVAAASRRDARGPAEFRLVVPAWLHGVDWAGDPLGSFPCARRQLDTLRELTAAAGLAVSHTAVGDPDPTAAIADAVEDAGADELLLCMRDRRLSAGPLDLAHRARRLTGLPVAQVAVARVPRRGGRRLARRLRRAGHCVAAAGVVSDGARGLAPKTGR